MRQQAMEPRRSGGAGTPPGFPGGPVAQSLATIQSHLSVLLGDPDSVETAYRTLVEAMPQDPSLALDVRLRLVRLLAGSRSRAAPALFRLLAADTASSARPAPLLAALLTASSGALRAEAVALAARLMEGGAFEPDLDLATALARALAGEEEHSLLDDAAALLERVADARLPLARGDPLGRFLEPSVPAPVRALAARILDREARPAPAERARRVLGARAAEQLAHYLAFTRARHEDLIALAPGPAPAVPALDSILAAEAVLGRDRLASTLSLLGWNRVAGSVHIDPVAVLRLDGSFPFVLTPVEARLAEQAVATQDRWDGWVVTAVGSEGDRQEPLASGEKDRIARFRRYSLDHAELLSEILEVAPVTAVRCRRALELLDRVMADYAALFADLDPDVEALRETYARLRARVAAALDEVPDDDQPLPADVAYQIQAFEDPSSVAAITNLHGLKRYTHQKGLRHAFRLFGSGQAANRTIDLLLLRDGHPPALVRRIAYIDFEGQEAPALPLAVRLLVDAYRTHLVHGVSALPRVRVLVYDTEVQLYVWYRNHPAFIRLDLSPPRRGGMIDLEYYAVSQYELDQHPDVGVPAIRRALDRLGFFVEMDGTRLHARYDKERAVDLSEIVDKAGLLMHLLPRLMDLDWAVSALGRPASDHDAIVDAWTDFMTRFGVIPPEPDAPPGTPASDVARRLRGTLRGAAIRLPPVRAGATGSSGGQGELEQAVLRPLRSALARDAVHEEGGMLRPAPRARYRREHESLRLARILAGGGRALRDAVRMAAAIRPLERWLRFDMTGTVQGYPVERTVLSFRDGDALVAMLRDDRGEARLAFAMRGTEPFRSRPVPYGPWEHPAELALPELLHLLVRDNYRTPGQEIPRTPTDRRHDVAVTFRAPNPRPPAAPLPGDRQVSGLPAAPGRASGPVRVAVEYRDPADFQDAVLLAPTVEPADAPCLARAAALVSTGGGSLSHVGLLALELGKPSLIVRGSWTRSPEGDDLLVVDRVEVRERSGRVRDLEVRCWERIRVRREVVREGDLVVVDTDEGTLRLLGADRDALGLHQGLRDLALFSEMVMAADDDAGVLDARGHLLRAMHQLDRTIARIDRPVLVHFAVRELVAAQADTGTGAGTRERTRLFDTLCAHPRAGATARAARAGAVDAMVHRLRGLTTMARSTIPTLEGPLEVLTVRLSVARLRAGLRAITELYPRGDPEARGARHMARAAAVADRLAAERLDTLRARLVQEASPDAPRARYALHGVDWIDQVRCPDDAHGDRTRLEQLRTALADQETVARRRCEEQFVIPAARAEPGVAPLIGRKAATLGEIARWLPVDCVPPWFAVTDRALRVALAAPVAGPDGGPSLPLAQAIDGVLERTDLGPGRKSAWIRDLWLRVRLPADLETALDNAYRDLASALGTTDPSVAIRSSTHEEDAAAGTWAGQFDTFLFVTGPASLRRHVRLAWAGLWSARALYRRGAGASIQAAAGGGVLVQRMVDARVAGVVVTADPVRGEVRELVINAGLGLGEGVVSGRVEADEIHVARNERDGGPLRLRYRVADKRTRVVFDTARGHGTRRVDTLFHQRLRPALEYGEVEALVSAAVALDRALGEPLDIEFALDGPDLRILQARAIPMFRSALAETLKRFPLEESRP
jgi:pyruvate, water dikinase